MEREQRLEEEKMLPLMVKMALPLIFSMAFQAVYNIADSLFLSHYSEIAFAGVSLIQPLVLITATIGSGIGTGTSSLLSKKLGEKDSVGAKRAVASGWALAISFILLCFLVLNLFGSFFIRFFTKDADTNLYALTYLRVFSLGIPFMYFSAMCSFLLQSHGSTSSSMAILVTGAVLNIILDPIFMFVLGMGVAGAAWATVLGHAAGSIVGLYLMLKLRPTAARPRFDKTSVKRITAIAAPAFLSAGAGNITAIVINRLVIGYGVEEMVVYGMYLKMESFMFLAASGISSAIVVISAYNLGAGKMDRVKASYRTALAIGWCTMLLGFLFMQLGARFLVSLFTSDPILVEKGVVCFRLTSCCLLFTAPNLILQGFMQGLGKGKRSLELTYTRFFLLMVPLAFLLSHFLGVKGVYLSYFAADLPTLLLVVYIYRKTAKEVGF